MKKQADIMKMEQPVVKRLKMPLQIWYENEKPRAAKELNGSRPDCQNQPQMSKQSYITQINADHRAQARTHVKRNLYSFNIRCR